MRKLRLISILILLLPALTWAQGSKTGRTTEGTLAARPACPSVANIGDEYVANDQHPVVATICDSTGWIPLGGGANPNGNNGDVQTKSGSNLAAGHINDNGSTLINSEDSQFTTNPYQDIRNYNIRAAKSSATTVTCTSGLATVTLGAAQTFINNVGVVARGCGAANGLSTPSAPTVTAAQLAGPPGSGLFVANSTGSTSYSYSVMATTELRGYTPASAVTTITNGPASLGVQNFTMSGWTASNSTVTVTTTASHGLVAGAMVWVQDFLLGNAAPYIVQTVPTGTTFTITIAADTRNGFPTSGGSSGTGFYYNAIHVSVPTNVSSVFQYFVYGGSAGSGNLLRPMLPQSNTAALSGDFLNNTLDDLGSAMMALPTLPDWVPATAPGAAKANDLVTTIVSGGGTTSLTLAATAGSNQSGVTFKEDDGPNLKAALTGSQASGAIIQVPAGVGVVTNSIVDVVSVNGWQIQQAGSVTLNDTLIATFGYWTGGPIIGAGSGPNFPFQGLPTITANGFPSVWFGPNTNNRSNWNNINFAGSTNGVIFLLDMGSIPQFGFSNSSMATTGTNDCISNHFISRTTPAGGAFERITNFSDSVGTCTVNSQAPAIILEDTRGNGPWSIQNLFLNRRGLYSGGVFIGKIDSVYMQAAVTPKLLFSNVGGVENGGPWIKISNSVEDTTFAPTVAYFGGGMAGHIYVEGSNGPGGGVPAITGSGGIFVHCLSNNTGAPVSTNNTCGAGVDSVIQYQSSVILDGLRNTGPTGQAVEYDNFNTILGPLYGLSATTTPMPAPVVSATSGGTVPTGNHSEQVAPVFPTGNGKFSEGPLSAPSNTVNVAGGTQTLTFSITPVVGAVGYDLYDNGFSVQCSAPYASGAPTTITWNGTPSRCGQSAPNGPGGGPTSVTANALTSPQVTTSGNGFTSSATAPNLSANRSETIPDVTGTRAEVTGSTTPGHCAQMGAVTGQITDSGSACGGFANPMTTLGDTMYENATPAPARLAGATSPNGVPQVFTSTPSGGVAQAPAWQPTGLSNRDITGTTSTDTILSTDCNNLINHKESVSNAVTLPTATTLGVPSCAFSISNNTTGAGTPVTITPTTWTITAPGGVASSAAYPITQGQTCRVSVDGATNWKIDCFDINQPGVFNFLNYGAVDDDSTDNCSGGTNAVALFSAAVNAYSGPGQPVAIIPAGPNNKAYKLATSSNACTFSFTIPVTVHVWGNIDCAQTANNCVSIGTSSGSLSNALIFPYRIDGGGTFTGGANLTNAGIEVTSGTNNSIISDLNFKNFGATNATLGNCTNYAILIDNPVSESTIARNHWQVTDNNNGRCGFSNPNGNVIGTNTIFWLENILGGQSVTNSSGCSSQGIVDGGSYAVFEHNNLYAFGVPVRMQGIGLRVANNSIDAAGCSAHSVNAALQFGAAGSSAAVGSFSIIGNTIQAAATLHTLNLFMRAGDSTASLHDVSLIGNMNSIPSPGSSSLNLIGGNQSCASSMINGSTLCYEYGNQGLFGLVSCGNTATGWQYDSIVAGCASSAQAANLGNTLLYTPSVVKSVLFTCQIIITQQATTSSTLPTCSVSFTDVFTNATQTIQVTPTLGGSATVGCNGTAVTNPPVGTSCQGSVLIVPKNGVAVNYSTSGYASVGGTPMQYQAFARANVQ